MTSCPAPEPSRRANRCALSSSREKLKTAPVKANIRLERLALAGPVRLGFTLNSPEFAFVRGDPRLKTLREKVGLPE